jgi:hypothetical protein
MTTSPLSPRVLKGAIVVDPVSPSMRVIVFQYNPDSVARTLQVQAAGDQTSYVEALRLKAPPQETIRLDVDIDAADQLASGTGPAERVGVHPSLASLETLLYPKSSVVIANEVLTVAGVLEVVPAEAPLTLLVWGPKRVVPVRITELSITEEAFDTNLNPIRASVALNFRVLSYHDLGLTSVGGAVFMAHQVGKERMASVGSTTELSAVGTFSLGL